MSTKRQNAIFSTDQEVWIVGQFLEFGSFFDSGLQNTHLQENSALETYFFWNFRHIPTTLGRLEFAPQFVQNCPLAPGLKYYEKCEHFERGILIS